MTRTSRGDQPHPARLFCSALLLLTLAGAAAGEAVLFLTDPLEVVEVLTAKEEGDCVAVRHIDGRKEKYCAPRVHSVVADTSFELWVEERVEGLGAADYQSVTDTLRFLVAGGLEGRARELAALQVRRYPGNTFLSALNRRGAEALDPCRWIAFDYEESISIWLRGPGKEAPHFETTVEEFRLQENFDLKNFNHGLVILGYYFFEEKRGLSAVLWDEGAPPTHWPTWLTPHFTLTGGISMVEAQPNTYHGEVVQHHWNTSLRFEVRETAVAGEGDPLFSYSAARVGKHSHRARAALEWGSRKLYLEILEDALLHACPSLSCDNPFGDIEIPEGIEPKPALHEELPPLWWDDEPHFLPPVRRAGDGHEGGRVEEGDPTTRSAVPPRSDGDPPAEPRPPESETPEETPAEEPGAPAPVPEPVPEPAPEPAEVPKER